MSLSSDYVLKMSVSTGTKKEMYEHIIMLARARQSSYVCASPVHACMLAFADPKFAQILQEADLVTPDGKPIVWALRKLGYFGQEQVDGPAMMMDLCSLAEEHGLRIGLFGGSKLELSALEAKLLNKYPKLNLAYIYSPPYRKLRESEEAAIIKDVNRNLVQLLFVGLGCPKQELWISKMRGSISAVMLGVGAAFSFHSGSLKRAPSFLRNIGLEWLFRLGQEPRRLFRRYMLYNSSFLWHSRCLNANTLKKYSSSGKKGSNNLGRME